MADSIERPLPSGANTAAFGSDVVAETLRALDIPYIALNPGASYRGLHDSLVNYLGNTRPQMLLCLHEESAVAIAHGYAKVTGRAMRVGKLPEPLDAIDVARFAPPVASAPSAELIAKAAALLKAAKNPVMLIGRVSRSEAAWQERIGLAEVLRAQVITDLKVGA